jgi:hypothetical protein
MSMSAGVSSSLALAAILDEATRRAAPMPPGDALRMVTSWSQKVANRLSASLTKWHIRHFLPALSDSKMDT